MCREYKEQYSMKHVLLNCGDLKIILTKYNQENKLKKLFNEGDP